MDVDANARLRRLVTQRMTVLADEGDVIAGLHVAGSNEYVVLAGFLESGTLLSLMIADKLFPCMGDQAQLLELLNRLNGDSMSGVHQLAVFPHGVIYSYKQTVRLQGVLDEALFDRMLAEGVSEFGRGIRQLCMEFSRPLGAKQEPDGRKMEIG